MMSFYGELNDPRKCVDGRIRSFPSKEALERTTFHFILSRLIDFKKCSNFSKSQIIEYLDMTISMWKNNNSQLLEWKNVLIKYM